MATSTLSTFDLNSVEAREAARMLDAQIESRIDLALTAEVLAKLARKGVSESAARQHLRVRAAQALIREAGR